MLQFSLDILLLICIFLLCRSLVSGARFVKTVADRMAFLDSSFPFPCLLLQILLSARSLRAQEAHLPCALCKRLCVIVICSWASLSLPQISDFHSWPCCSCYPRAALSSSPPLHVFLCIGCFLGLFIFPCHVESMYNFYYVDKLKVIGTLNSSMAVTMHMSGLAAMVLPTALSHVLSCLHLCEYCLALFFSSSPKCHH